MNMSRVSQSTKSDGFLLKTGELGLRSRNKGISNICCGVFINEFIFYVMRDVRFLSVVN